MSFHFPRSEPPRRVWLRASDRFAPDAAQHAERHATLHAAAIAAVACATLLVSVALA